MIIRGTGGHDDLTGSSGDDDFIMTQGGDDTVSGGDGNDVFRYGAALTAADHIDGGDGEDVVILRGDYAGGVTFAADTMVNVESLSLIGPYSYDLATSDSTVAAGAALTVKGNAIGAGHALIFDGSAETDGRFHIVGSAGDDLLTGGAKGDAFRLENGGNDTAHGGGGNDVFYLGANLNGSDVIDGGGGHDMVLFDGDYSAHGFVSMTGITAVEAMEFAGGHSYLMKGVDANVAAGTILTVTSLDNANVIYDGTAETDGAFHFIVGPTASCGFDGGAGNDVYDDLTSTAQSSANLGGGDDIANFGANYSSHGQFVGGGGYDIVTFDGDYSGTLAIAATNFSQIDKVVFYGGHSYANVMIGDVGDTDSAMVEADCSALLATDSITISAYGPNATYHFIAGAGTNNLTGGTGNDIFDLTLAANATVTGREGADMIIAGAGNDTFRFFYAAQSTSTSYDTITNVDFSHDLFKVSNFVPGAIDAAVSSGALSTASFDSDLATAIGAGQLGGHEAVLFTPDSGGLSGHTFLIVDINGTAGYQAGADLVVDITGYTGTMTTGDFI